MNKYISKFCVMMLILLTIFSNFTIIKTNAIDISDLEIKESEDGQLSVSGVMGVDDVEDTVEYQEQHMNERYGRYITVISFITAIAAITMLGIFIKHVVHFAALGTEHWIVRRNTMFGLLWSGVSFMLLGSATLIMALAYNAFSFV